MLKNEDYADEEVESELAPIAVQLAYVQQVGIGLSMYSFCKLLIAILTIELTFLIFSLFS